MAKPDDQRLLCDLRAGQHEASAELVRTHYQAVYRFLIHLTGDVHEAEDLTQETFATVWARIATFEGRSALASWLHRIAYTKFIDARRAERRATRAREQIAVPARTAPDPFVAATAADEADRLYRMLQTLPTQERVVLVLHYLQGLSYREMAEILEEPAGTVKWRTGVALARLRGLWDSKDPDHAPRTETESGSVG